MSKPVRGISRYMEQRSRIERQLERWDAEMTETGVAPTDKVRTLLRFAYDELRRETHDTVQAKVMGQ